MSLIKNASPEFIALGTKDLSIRVVPLEAAPLPLHLPIFFVHTKKGPVDRQVVDASTFNVLFGNDSLESHTPYYNHQTRYLKAALAYNSSVMVQRIRPKDAKVKANIVVYMDVLKTNLINYKRNSDGSLVPNADTNDYEINMDSPVVSGYRVKWIVEHVTDYEEENLGTYVTKPGTMVDDNGTASTMYPIFEARASNFGQHYNNIGFAIGGFYGDDLDESIKESTNSLPFKLTIYNRASETSSPVQFNTLYGEPFATISLRKRALNPISNERMDIEKAVESQWYNISDTNLPYVYPDFEGIYFYRDNYEEVTRLFVEAERKYVSIKEDIWADNKKASTISWYDFTTNDQAAILDQNYMINPFSAMSSKKVKYFALQLDDAIAVGNEYQREINMSNEVPIFLEGGFDGTVDNKEYEESVVDHMRKYGDANSEYQDLAVNVENILWDSGFTVETKKELVQFISTRKDTVLVLSTHDSSLQKPLSLSDTRAVAIALKTRLKLAPESTYYGTPVARAMVVAGTYLVRDGDNDDRVPLTYDLMVKTCKMMGAADGKWKREYLFDRVYNTVDNPGSLITSGADVQPKFIPANVKPSLWTNGVVWAQPFDLSSFHFPALQTIYENDTSVLNSFFTLMGLSALTKINAEAWRRFTGTTDLTDGEFIDLVENWLRNATIDRFADMFGISHEVIINDADKARGYSWQQVSTIYAGTLRTVCVYSSLANRLEDMPQNESADTLLS